MVYFDRLEVLEVSQNHRESTGGSVSRDVCLEKARGARKSPNSTEIHDFWWQRMLYLDGLEVPDVSQNHRESTGGSVCVMHALRTCLECVNRQTALKSTIFNGFCLDVQPGALAKRFLSSWAKNDEVG